MMRPTVIAPNVKMGSSYLDWNKNTLASVNIYSAERAIFHSDGIDIAKRL
jgi:hypothetical protein